MSQANPAQDQALVEYKVDRVLDETNTDTKIIVLARQDGVPIPSPFGSGPRKAMPSSWHSTRR